MTLFDLERDSGFRDWLDGARDGRDDWSVPTFRRAVEDRFAPRRPRPWTRPAEEPVDVADATPERDPARPEVAMRERRRMALERLKVTEKPRRGPLVNLFGSKRVPFWDVQKGPAPVGYYVLAVVITLFVMLGLVMVLSASAQTEAARGRSPYHIFNRQLMWAALGTVGLVIALRVSLTWLRRLSVPLLVIAGAGMLAPFTPGLGVTINEARAWIAVGNFTMQPSEFLKLALVIFAADLLVRRKDDLSDVRRSLKPLILLAGFAGLTTPRAGRPRLGDRDDGDHPRGRVHRRRPLDPAARDRHARCRRRGRVRVLQRPPVRPVHGVPRHGRTQGPLVVPDVAGPAGDG